MENIRKYESKQAAYMRKYRSEHPEQKIKAREQIRNWREQQKLESDIMYDYTERMILAPGRAEFAKACIECLDELGYDTGELWNRVH